MTPEQAARAKELFCDLLELEPAEHEERLADAPPEAEVRERVRELLRDHERASALLGPVDEPGAWGGAWIGPPVAEPAELARGTRIEDYVVLDTAGRGGFGTVYVAEQTRPVQRRVALKVLHPGLADPTSITRFEAERQTLARMEHPAIAHVLDAGQLPGGSPWFAMEYVAGDSLTTFCEAHGLDLEGRLRLFRTVCLAVHHAHQKGVIHRDLKPGNVLVAEVDGTPYPKVIDFGIAKLVERSVADLSVVSTDGELIGTPAYMSPEQARGDRDVDTRADVYALGAMLFELLTGRPPFDAKRLGLPGMIRAIAEQEPTPPGRLARDAAPHPAGPARTTAGPAVREIPPDLDWIALRCLEKDRQRRYASASALADDIERFLAGRPVEAAPPSLPYRARKLATRHRFAFAASVAFVLALAAGGYGTVRGLVRARRANAELTDALGRLEREVEVSTTVNAFLNEDLLGAGIPSTEPGHGRNVTLREVIDRAADELETQREGGRFADLPQVEAALRSTLGEVYKSLGDLERARVHLAAARRLYTEAGLGTSAKGLATSSFLGRVLVELNDLEEAEPLLVEVLESQGEVRGPHHPEALLTARGIAQLRRDEGRLEEAVQVLELALARTTDGSAAPDPELGRATLQAELMLRSSLAALYDRVGRVDEAEAQFRAHLAGLRELEGEGSPETWTAAANLAAFLQAQGRPSEAGTTLRETLERLEPVLGPRHPTTLTVKFNLGTTLRDQGAHAEAQRLLEEVLAGREAVLGEEHPETLWAASALGLACAALGEDERAEELLARAFEETAALLGRNHPTTDSRRKSYASFLHGRPGREEDCLQLAYESVEALRAHGGDRAGLLRSICNVGILLKDAGRLDEAEPHLREALEGSRVLYGPDHLETLASETSLAGLYLEQGRLAEAERLARHAARVGEATLDEHSPDLARARATFGLVLHEKGDTAEALALLRKARDTFARVHGPEHRTTRFVTGHLERIESAAE